MQSLDSIIDQIFWLYYRILVYNAVVFWIVPRQGHLVLVTVSFTILFVPAFFLIGTAMADIWKLQYTPYPNR